METILFQGDSITDANRSKDTDANFGHGYALLVKSQLDFENPKKYKCYNRGISGNRVTDVYCRIKRDIINLKPDVMSILIGVNDVWHEVDLNMGVDADKYFKIYSMLIEEVKEALPDIKIIILEPFILKGTATEAKWDVFKEEVLKRAQKSKEIAQKYNLKFIPLQKKFDKLAEDTDATFWLVDGVHPSEAGHELIKREWIKVYNEL